jgi:predicted TIM-barrel fold metal-dependent hydrolase
VSVSIRCDAHVHIVGPLADYPQVATDVYVAAPAELDTLRRHGDARGISRFVIVQPSFYGIDNRLLLESLDALGGDGCGVAVIDATRPPDDLADYARRGVRGLRLNLYSPTRGAYAGDSLTQSFVAASKVAQALGWHVQVIAALPMLLECAAMLARAPVPVVLDHYGLYGHARPDSAEGRGLLDLVGLPHVWMKLSAPYRVSDDPLDTRPDTAWLEAMLARAPDRCVWGSDWPYVPPHGTLNGGVERPYRDIPYDRMVDDFLRALGSGERAERVMVQNPARLYGFDS